jgi:predicted O-methyltransferase YrrM
MRIGCNDDGQYYVNEESINFWISFPPHNVSLKGFIDFIQFLTSKKIENLIEVGSFQGESTTLFAHYLPESKIYSVDPFLSNYDDSDLASNSKMDDVECNFDRRISLFENIIKMKLASENASQKFDEKSVDVVYIDANHIHEEVVNDITFWLPKIKTGGYISGHDFYQVKDAVENTLGGYDMIFDDTTWIKLVS